MVYLKHLISYEIAQLSHGVYRYPTSFGSFGVSTIRRWQSTNQKILVAVAKTAKYRYGGCSG